MIIIYLILALTIIGDKSSILSKNNGDYIRNKKDEISKTYISFSFIN